VIGVGLKGEAPIFAIWRNGMETFRLGDFTIDLIDNPEQTLEPSEKQKLTQESIPVARKAYRNENVTEYDIIIHAINVSTGVYMKDGGGKLIAFSTCVPETILGRTVIHLKATTLLPEYQGKGIYGIVTAVRILREAEKHDVKDLLIGTRTQSPLVYRFMCRLGLYPQMHDLTPDSIKPIAEAYAGVIRDKHSEFKSRNGLEFDRDTLVIRHAYGTVDEKGQESGFSMYGNRPPWLKGDDETNEFVRRHLTLSAGDAFLMIGPFQRDKCLDMLSRSLYKLNPSRLSLVERFRS